MNEDGPWESPALVVNGGNHMEVGVSSSCSSPPAFRIPQDDTAMINLKDHCRRDEEESLLTDTADYMSDSNCSHPQPRKRCMMPLCVIRWPFSLPTAP
jgi:hypothetical protein